MKRFLLVPVLLFSFFSCDQLEPLVGTYGKHVNGQDKPSESEIISGLKEALTVGITNAVLSSSKEDGFYGNSLIKIPIPPELEKVNKTMRDYNMGKYMDDFELSLNRAAEMASAKATDIFVDAISKMTFQDVMNIWQGNDDAATEYLHKNTYSQLSNEFKPIAKQAIQEAEVTKYWNDIANVYNKIPLVKKVNPDLDQYVTDKAIEGLFILVAKEEKKIRENPAARVSGLLEKVFGYLDQ